MVNIAIVLTHNKGDTGNAAQISTLKSLLTEVVDGPFTNPETGETWTTIHHELIGLPFPHSVKVYQVIPFGVTPPPNRNEVNSGGMVYYRAGDEDKIGDHPRFFNWGLKRGTDNGAEVVVHLEDVSKLVTEDLAVQLNTIIDPDTKEEYLEDTSVKIASLKLLKEVGQLDETKTKIESIAEMKGKLEVKNG